MIMIAEVVIVVVELFGGPGTSVFGDDRQVGMLTPMRDTRKGMCLEGGGRLVQRGVGC